MRAVPIHCLLQKPWQRPLPNPCEGFPAKERNNSDNVYDFPAQ